MHVAFAFIRRDALKNHPLLYPVYLIIDSGLGLVYWYFIYLFVTKIWNLELGETFKLPADYFSFGVVGLVFLQYAWKGFSIFSNRIISEQFNGSLESLWVTPYPFPFLVFVSGIWNFILVNLSVALLLFIGTYHTNPDFELIKITQLMLIGLLTSMAMGSLGLIVAAPTLMWGRSMKFFQQLLTKIIPFLSGAFFPVSFLPSWLKTLSWGLPTTHAITLARQIMVPSLPVESGAIGAPWTALILTTLVLSMGGWIVFSLAVKQARINGGLCRFGI